ncbi:MAG: FAD-dependent oxidoreductase, partial [Pseudomonadota bacterium]
MNSDQKTDGKSLVIIGAGPMGLAAAYLAAKKGWSVTLLEADDRVGGMAAHFDFDGMSIERYYHFCCLSDIDTIDLLEDLGLNGAMKWVTTTMGFYVNRELHDWGHPVALLRFPGMNFFEKLRYGVQAFYSTKRSDWERLDTISAKDWFTDWCGPGVYERMWRPLMELKFYEYSDKISAAWMWQRIKRLGNSRKSLFEERLGYIDGGTDTLMKALEAKIQELGGQIHLSCPATEIVADEGKTLTGVRLTNGETVHAENIVSTAPMPVVPRLLEKSLPDLADQYTDFDNIGVVCVMLKLNQSVSRHFWVNISDESVGVPGIV